MCMEYEINFMECIKSKKNKSFVDKYTKENMLKIIDNVLKYYNNDILKILKGEFNSKRKEQEFKTFRNMITARFHRINKDMNDMFVWYCKEKNIIHPLCNRKINRYDFKTQPPRYWTKEENRINRIKYYCEEECKENILNVVNDTEQLKIWIYKYFKKENVCNMIPDYQKYAKSLYGLLIETYPSIEKNHILFNWEWHQWNKYDKELLIKMLRDLVFYRMNEIILNPIEDIPKYLNMSCIDNFYPKFNKQIDKKIYKSYYEWAIEAFPEYADKWTKKDFGKIVAFDNEEFDSYQEKDVYEFIKKQDIFKYIKNIGKQHFKGKYNFKLDETYEYQRFCPDFVIEHIYLNNKKILLNKPVVLEFYGMYEENNKNHIFQNYVKKTKVKEQFYKSREDIYYISIFPSDIRNNYEELTKKLTLFFISNLNIDIK